MLDINLIRENPERVRKSLLKRIDEIDFTELLEWDKERRNLIIELDSFRAKKNDASKQIPILKKEGKDIIILMEEMKVVSGNIQDLEERVRELDEQIHEFLAVLPNIPDDDVPAGGKESNQVVRTFEKKPVYDFPAKDHVKLAEDLNLIDYTRAAKMSGRGFWIYKGDGARLEWALINYFIEEHLNDGFEFILPPHILNYESGFTAGQFPKFIDDVFEIKDGEKMRFILPTAETALANFHREEILQEEELPKKYFSYTPCYRKEAGSYRTEERGMVRGHQFNKIELFQYCKPEDSEKILDEMIEKAERLVKDLGLHYRVSLLAARDASAGMAKTYDIEVWIPSMEVYKEVSSASNARDYQARRGNVRFKNKVTGKNEFVHTLNASGLATSRIFPAILEQFQRKDGTVIVPEVLRKWAGREVLR